MTGKKRGENAVSLPNFAYICSMKKPKNLIISISDIITLVVIVSILFLIPTLIMVAMGNSWLSAFCNLKYALPPLFVIISAFLTSYYLLIPQFLIKTRSTAKFILYTILCYMVLGAGSNQLGHFIYPDVSTMGFPKLPVEAAIAFHLCFFLVNMLLIYTAMSIRFNQRNRALEVERAQQEKEQAQNELMRLKGQLNPHFLFNTLNNISSLSAFDPDATQESISRLSDMLRYVLYESSAEKVPLQKDIEFMQNYMNLMQIRYEDTLKLEVSMQVSNPDVQVPPMLFISLLENAYKYGATSLHPCTLTVQLHDEADGSLHFCMENTLLTPQEMASKKRGGLGLENLKKRLDLMYPEKHTFTYGETENKSYKAEIHILCN